MPDINLAGVLTLPLLLGIALVIVVFVLGVLALAAGLNRTERDLTITLRPLLIALTPKSQAARQEAKMYGLALTRLTDLEQGLVSLVEADAVELEERAEDWLDYVCEGLARVLGAGNHADFRVAIWTDDEPDREFLKGLAYCGFDRNDPKYAKLPRATTVAGWVIANRQDHYVPDTDNDPIYRPHKHRPNYRSMYACPLGTEDDPWASMTVSAPALDGLSEERRALVRRFGDLASVGARIVRVRLAATTRTVGT